MTTTTQMIDLLELALTGDTEGALRLAEELGASRFQLSTLRRPLFVVECEREKALEDAAEEAYEDGASSVDEGYSEDDLHDARAEGEDEGYSNAITRLRDNDLADAADLLERLSQPEPVAS